MLREICLLLDRILRIPTGGIVVILISRAGALVFASCGDENWAVPIRDYKNFRELR
jgi:hypothetical protein